MPTLNQDISYELCINSAEHEDLENSNVYPVIPDSTAEREGYLRVVDESGEDYLYPVDCFVPIDIPLAAREALSTTWKH